MPRKDGLVELLRNTPHGVIFEFGGPGKRLVASLTRRTFSALR